MKFIHTLDGKYTRLNTNAVDSSIDGLCANDITSCCIIVLISQLLDKYVMIHGDLSLNGTDVIRKQIAWAGADCRKFVFYRPEGYQSKTAAQSSNYIFNALWPREITIEHRHLTEQDEVVYVRMGEQIPACAPTLREDDIIEYHPQIALLEAHHKITAALSSLAFLPILLFRSPEELTAYTGPCLFDNAWAQHENIAFHGRILALLKRASLDQPAGCVDIYNNILINKTALQARLCNDNNFHMVNAAYITLYHYIKSGAELTFSKYLQFNLTSLIPRDSATRDALGITSEVFLVLWRIRDKNSAIEFLEKLPSLKLDTTFTASLEMLLIIIINTQVRSDINFDRLNTNTATVADCSLKATA